MVRRAFEAANKIGDLTYAAYSCQQLNTNLLAAGDALSEAEREARLGLAFAQKARFGLVSDNITTKLGLIRTLRGLTPTFGSFDDEQFDEAQIERHFSENPDLASAGITNVIWATSYKFDFSLVKLPIFDDDGYPIQTRGATTYPGLFFVGLPWLHDAKSGLIYGVGDDAAYVARKITNGAQLTHRRPSPELRGRRSHQGAIGQQAAGCIQKRAPQSGAQLPGRPLWRAFRIAALALVTATATAGLVLAQQVAPGNTGTRDVALAGVGHRVAMSVGSLHAGADGVEVERVLGRPASTTLLDALGTDRSLVYADETVRTEVTLTANRVTAVALDLLPIDSRSLPMRARMVKAMMRRSGVLALLGKPESDERRATSGLETERMMFRAANRSEFSVLLAGGLVVDMTAGNERKTLGVRPFVLPAAIPDASVGSDLRIGLSPKQADALLGPPVYLPVPSALEGEPVLYETRFTGSGCRVVSLKFIGEALTAFTIWPPETATSLGVSCTSVAGHHH